ncbi:hypothetical protein QQP08_025940 [Theobroma cacao]|nr:hypothetical protein QQP08_024697 [Theobroma cacao]WRX33453.1 hypothetical protein QQP08_025940 [Theobroma cacao]
MLTNGKFSVFLPSGCDLRRTFKDQNAGVGATSRSAIFDLQYDQFLPMLRVQVICLRYCILRDKLLSILVWSNRLLGQQQRPQISFFSIKDSQKSPMTVSIHYGL